MAQAYRQRPSELLQIDWQENDWLAYSFDRAVMLYGQYVDREAEKREKEGTPIRKLEDILAAGPIQPPPAPKAQDLIAAFGTLVVRKP